MVCFQTGCLTVQTLGGSIICTGLLQGDAELETKGSGVRLIWLMKLLQIYPILAIVKFVILIVCPMHCIAALDRQ